MNLVQAITETILELNTDKALLKVDMAVMAALCKHINHATLDCFPAIGTIAERVKSSERTVKRSLKRLRQLEYITVTHNYGKYGQRSNTYTVHGISQRLANNDNQLKNNNNIAESERVMGGVTPDVTPILTTKINNNNILSNVQKMHTLPKPPEQETKMPKITTHDTKITPEEEKNPPKHTIKLADDAKIDRIPLGNPLCPMTSDYPIPTNWITWAMVTYDATVDQAKQVTLDYVRHYIDRKDYSTGGQFQSMGWERLYRTYWADYIEAKLKAKKAEQDKTCSCGKHHAGREYATPYSKAKNIKWSYLMGIGYTSDVDLQYLADYELHHGIVWDDRLESSYKIKITRWPDYETMSRIAKLSLPHHLISTDLKMAS